MDYRDMGRKIRSLRKSCHLTQAQLATQLGLSASFLGHLERGTRIASIDTLAQLCNVLKVSPAYLMESALNPCNLDIPTGLTETEVRKLNVVIALYCREMRNNSAKQ